MFKRKNVEVTEITEIKELARALPCFPADENTCKDYPQITLSKQQLIDIARSKIHLGADLYEQITGRKLTLLPEVCIFPQSKKYGTLGYHYGWHKNRINVSDNCVQNEDPEEAIPHEFFHFLRYNHLGTKCNNKNILQKLKSKLVGYFFGENKTEEERLMRNTIGDTAYCTLGYTLEEGSALLFSIAARIDSTIDAEKAHTISHILLSEKVNPPRLLELYEKIATVERNKTDLERTSLGDYFYGLFNPIGKNEKAMDPLSHEIGYDLVCLLFLSNDDSKDLLASILEDSDDYPKMVTKLVNTIKEDYAKDRVLKTRLRGLRRKEITVLEMID